MKQSHYNKPQLPISKAVVVFLVGIFAFYGSVEALGKFEPFGRTTTSVSTTQIGTESNPDSNNPVATKLSNYVDKDSEHRMKPGTVQFGKPGSTIRSTKSDDVNCEQVTLAGDEWEEALGPINQIIFANDLSVAPNEEFTLHSINFNAVVDTEFSVHGVSLYFYENSGNGPGEEIGAIFSLPPTSIVELGTIQNFNQVQIEVDLVNPFTLIGGSTISTYWVGLQLQYSGPNAFMEVTSGLNTMFDIYFKDPNFGWLAGSDPAAFGLEYDGVISFYGVCNDISSCDGAPEAGSIVSHVGPNTCAGDPVHLSAQGYTQEEGVNYQWQKLSISDDDWMVIAGQNSGLLSLPDGIQETTQFRFYAECENSGEGSYSSPFTLYELCYCTPITGCSMTNEIGHVTLIGETQILDNPSGCSSNGYGDFTYLSPADMYPGAGYELSVHSNVYFVPNTAQFKVWIDFDQNGSFESDEIIATTFGNGIPTSGTALFNITIPQSALPGQYTMRVKLSFNNGDNFHSCSFGTGETEDYIVEILEFPLECSAPVTAGTPVGNFEICADTPFNLEVIGASDPSSGLYGLWQSSADGVTGWVDIPGATSTVFTLHDGISEQTYFRYKVECQNDGDVDFSDVLEVSIRNPLECYCIPIANCSLKQKITNVTLEGETIDINNDSDCSEGSYGDYTSLPAADLMAGNAYILSVSTEYEFTYLQTVKAWIDFNNDGTMDSSEEIVASEEFELITGSNPFIFNVPDTLSPGIYRLRVRLVYNSPENIDFDSCQNSRGETEDYHIEVMELEDCQNTPSAGIPDEGLEVCADTPFILSVSDADEPAEGLMRTWQSSPIGQDEWTDIDGASSPFYEMAEGISQSMRFRYRVHCSYSDETDVSDEIEVTLLSPGECLCIPNYETGGCIEGITAITKIYLEGETVTLDNPSGCSEEGYGDYRDLPAADLIPEGTYELSITTAAGFESKNIKAWIDFNADGILEDNEIIVNTYGYGMTGMTTSYTFSVPETVEPGQYALRVRLHHGTIEFGACSNTAGSGEVEDYFIEVINAVSATDSELPDFSYYPNPVDHTLQLQSDLPVDRVVFHDMLGREVMDLRPGAVHPQLHLGNLRTGLYTMRVTIGDRTATFKVLKR